MRREKKRKEVSSREICGFVHTLTKQMEKLCEPLIIATSRSQNRAAPFSKRDGLTGSLLLQMQPPTLHCIFEFHAKHPQTKRIDTGIHIHNKIASFEGTKKENQWKRFD